MIVSTRDILATIGMDVKDMSREPIIQRFGEKLHLLRVHYGLTLKELAIALGYTAHGHISELETGKKTPTAEFVLKVARFFAVSTDCLLKDELEVEINNAGQPSKGET